MNHAHHRIAPLACALSLTACWQPGTIGELVGDAGLRTQDGGTSGADASGPADSGQSADAGRLVDAGRPADSGQIADAGQIADSGQTVDSGQIVDAGQSDDAGQPGQDGGANSKPTGAIRVDNIGWRPADAKVAVLLGNAGATVQLRRSSDNSVVGTYTASGQATDEDSGDAYSTVDFSAFATPGDYYLYLPPSNSRSYVFTIAENVYAVVGAVAAKSYYYQRCNHDKAQPHATDALAGFQGHGSKWEDGTCHSQDSSLGPGPGSENNGTLDLHGGWHDAGDYQKTLWGRGVPEMLFAYEINPTVWTDSQLNIPESGNGMPDLLDEVGWELDFYLRMQRPDGHFMSSAKGHNGTKSSPPSASDEQRVYFDCTSPDGNGWSGGNVTLKTATGNAVLALAHAAIVFRALGKTAIAEGYAAAAKSGWNWLNGQSATGDEQRLKAAAASAVYRMDSTVDSAKAVVESFAWNTWDGKIAGGSATPSENLIANGAWHLLLNDAASADLKTKARTGVLNALVETAFNQEGAYGGMFGGPGNGWEYSWGSNRNQSQYGANLFMAAHFNIVGSHPKDRVILLAQKHFHYMVGLNPLNMVYLTNMAAYGGEHSSFQIFHGWFSATGGDGDHGNVQYNGKPTWVDEPLYPYYPDDNQTSEFGPAPGLVPGGPNYYYSSQYTIPNKDKPAYAYRDFSVGCDWSGSACRASSWEITEPMQGYQGPFILLVSFMMAGP